MNGEDRATSSPSLLPHHGGAGDRELENDHSAPWSEMSTNGPDRDDAMAEPEIRSG